MKRKILILKITSIILSTFSFFAMLFPFVLTAFTRYFQNTSTSGTEQLSFKEWLNVLEIDSNKIWGWQVARIFMILTLIVAGLIIVISVIEFFINNKYIIKTSKYVAICGIIIAALFIIFFFIGCILQFGSSEYYSCAVFPHVGPLLLSLSVLAASILSLKSLKTK